MDRRGALKLSPGARIVFGDSMWSAKVSQWREGTVQFVTDGACLKTRRDDGVIEWVPYHHVGWVKDDVSTCEPSISLTGATVADIETLPNCFTLTVLGLYSDLDLVFEISDQGRDDRQCMLAWFDHWQQHQTPMVGFNVVNFDYPVLHFIWQNPHSSNAWASPGEFATEIYEHAQSIIRGNHSPFGSAVYPSDRLFPLIDLYKLWHFDNRAKSTSLKALQFAMRSESVMEMPIAHDQYVTRDQIDRLLIPYNRHDVTETRKFAHISMDAIKFRLGLMDELQGDVLNWSDTKIGSKILEQRLGVSSRVETTQRERIALNEIIFPYIKFNNPEFQRILDWMRQQTITEDEVTGALKTKGVFTGVRATVGDIDSDFVTGGIHGSVSNRRYVANEAYGIYDVDVASLYPSIAIVNRLYPEHLGEQFVDEYAKLLTERKKYKKGTVWNAAYKLAANGTYGNSNNPYSPFYDPKFTMSITVNGQLMLAMLAELLLTVPSLELIQCNTDGVTYWCHRAFAPRAAALQKAWENYTCLKLEQAEYRRMFLRDVNNYIGESPDGKLKMKGAYWYAKSFPDDITNAGPPAWHKDFSAQVVIKAAVEHMVTGIDIERFVYGHSDPFDFMCRAKVDRSSRLMIGDQEVQRITRYYVALNGGEMKKISPPTGPLGAYKRRNGVSEAEYARVMSETNGEWSELVCTKNKSKYETREMAIEAGYRVAECNKAATFDFKNVNYQWYVDAAKKLVIG